MINFKKTKPIVIFFLVLNYSFLNSQSISGEITFRRMTIIPNKYKKNSNKRISELEYKKMLTKAFPEFKKDKL